MSEPINCLKCERASISYLMEDGRKVEKHVRCYLDDNGSSWREVKQVRLRVRARILAPAEWCPLKEQP